ncbi:hypothetical protein EDC17_101638 [Sphingobacterium alimentarium]|uniref:Outer membrane protein with beta-barrel domain n=1 Tax=Sphingobacterium alimentarium TaxID=797292 RepID=A0A4V2VUA3_9SPHI|nr:hypothetical protein [Sphingobacterium alimentarium]TCV14133.1 hypothetical protein EDC17_101638 [Sphingobacterium alimentarium]
MQKVIRNIFLLAAGIFLANDASAQLTSQHAIGARFGSASGINYRYTLSQDRAIEGILSVQSNSTSNRFRVVGLYEYHKELPLNNFSWYYGFGGSIGNYTYKAYTNSNGEHIPKNSELLLSIDGIVGIEYSLPTAPISLSLDVKPYFDFVQESSIKLFDPIGFSIRYKF